MLLVHIHYKYITLAVRESDSDVLCRQIHATTAGPRTVQRVNPFNPELNYHCHLRPIQAANCCPSSRLVVDDNDDD